MRILISILCIACGAVSVYPIGQPSYVEFSSKPNSFRLVAGGLAVPILVDSEDAAGVLRAAGDLQTDIVRVTGIRPKLVSNAAIQASDVLIIGTLGMNRRIEELIKNGKLNAEPIKGRWEAYAIQIVADPYPGVKRALVIAGSDKRGTIFGTYDLSEQIGVSPWYWWADVPVEHHSQLYIRAGTRIVDEPKVKYRGLFINDEAPALDGWVKEKFGNFNHRFYEKVFELILRMKGNFLWPAMWNNAFYDDDPLNAKLADEYGIVMSTSHHEPMMRAQKEWKRYGKGEWNYDSNADVLRSFWTEGVRRGREYERIITLGMRGDGDMPMSREANTTLLERIVADQRKIISETVDPNLAAVPQVWALYKEVQEYYEKGMRVPDDVTLLWSDDNWGNIRRLPTTEEQGRGGGAGVYYHFDYVGGPRSYKWLNTIPITKVAEQMHLADAYGAKRIWLVNVGDIKPLEFPTEFFLSYAWDPERWSPEKLVEYTRLWATREFGSAHAAEIADIVAKYTKYNGRRKPELLEPNNYSLVNYREAETVVADYNKIADQAERLYKLLPIARRDAFYQLVLYPVKACANLNEMYVTIGKNRMYAVQGRASTNTLAERSRELFRNDAELTRYYNESLAGGKWPHMMDQTHIGYTYWNQPVRNAMPGVQEIQVPAKGEMGIAVEGAADARELALPAQSVYEKQPGYFEIFNRGLAPFTYVIRTDQPWLRISQTNGTVGKDQRIWVSVDWKNAPVGVARGAVTVSSSDGQKAVIAVPVINPASPRPEDVTGFIESDGYVSIEAEHFTNSSAPAGFKWQVLPDFGRTLSGITVFPVNRQIPANSMRLEYNIYLSKDGPVSVDAYFAPTQKFQPGDGLRYAISFDNEPPQVINFHVGYNQPQWEASVRDGVRVLTSRHSLTGAGYHTLRFWAVDPGLVIEKFVVNTGGLKPSYLGPPESYFRAAVRKDP